MLNPELWSTGLITMVVGMGTVFCFLVILVFAINIMVKCVEFINKVCPLPTQEAKTAKKATTDDTEIALAIAVASTK